MGIRENLQRLIDKKQLEITDLEQKIRDAKTYLQAVQDSMRTLPREAMDYAASLRPRELRPGTAVAQTRDFIKAAGHPLHITEILKGIGKSVDKKSRVSLSGSLAGYVRDGQIFTRPAPNTFGLIEFANNGNRPEELPSDFGR